MNDLPPSRSKKRKSLRILLCLYSAHLKEVKVLPTVNSNTMTPRHTISPLLCLRRHSPKTTRRCTMPSSQSCSIHSRQSKSFERCTCSRFLLVSVKSSAPLCGTRSGTNRLFTRYLSQPPISSFCQARNVHSTRQATT